MASRHALAALALALALSFTLLSVAAAAPLPADNPSPAVLFSRPALVAVAPPPTAAHRSASRDTPVVPPVMKLLPDFQAKHPLVPVSADQVHVHPVVAGTERNVPPVGVISARDILAPSHAPSVVAVVPKRGGGGSLLWNALSARFQAPSQRQRAVRAAAVRPGPMLMHAVDASDHATAAACESPSASCGTDSDAHLVPPAAPALDELLAEALKETTLVFSKPRVRVEL
ncbi:hypothetical protein AMAG_07323 [Allomyces macrogynus ATCC 38327]|uniref:Uncharacterized protein n=1 Tax=Allomyces macrogynus (strain ATCC 38327) TaxID=578462 RepID=A0A0L0SHZ0_ALLM3|nr:hypothetical protein AMAG_07323 [Allomyces macrogynus ATCC 38327]|eukprot:KNE62069.1 hypothetical protein AMAG_07323 [Allomyces macrogynus ATCC 38327]